MAKLKATGLKSVERQGAFKQPKPGLYTGKITKIDVGKSKAGNQMLTCSLKITNRKGPQKEYKDTTVFTRVLWDHEGTEWKRAEFLDAVGLTGGGKKDSVTLDTDAIVGTEIQFLVKASEYEGEYRADVGRLMSMEETADDAEEESEEEEIESEEEEESEEADEEDEEGEEGEEEEEESYNDWSAADLKLECEERGLPKTGGKSVLVARLIENDENAEDPFE